MKKFLAILVIGLFIAGISKGQVLPDKSVLKLSENSIQTIDTLVYRPNMDIDLGWAPKEDFNAFKFDLSFNRILFKYVGVYTSFEKGLDSDYFSNILGLNISIHRYFYIFGGMDFFTDKYGILSHKGFDGTRKEIGIGLYPYKNWVIRFGSSFDVATTLTIGYCIPFKNKSF